MKIAILVLVVVALLGPGAISVIAYKLKVPWSNPSDRRGGRCGEVGGHLCGYHAHRREYADVIPRR